MMNIRIGIGLCCALVVASVSPMRGTTQAVPLTRILDLPSRFSAPAELRFEHGFVLIIERSPSAFPAPGDQVVSVLNADGREIFTRAPSKEFPDARIVTLENATINPDGILVVAVQAWNAQGSAAAALVVYDTAAGRPLRVIRTNPVICLTVVLDDQQEVWCLGPDAEAARAGRDNYSLLWRYSLTGQLLAQALPRKTFNSDRNPWNHFATLTADGETLSAWFPSASAFVELKGSELRIDLVPAAPGPLPHETLHFVKLPGQDPLLMATTRGSVADRNSLYRGFFQLDRSGGRWNKLTRWPELPIGIWPIGVDHGQIILWDRYQRSVVRMSLP
jgi:hypothetical protein